MMRLAYLCLLALAGCSSSAAQTSLHLQSATEYATDTRQAAFASPNPTPLQVDTQISVVLDDDDPIVLVDRFRSFYEVLTFRGRPSASYIIEAQSIGIIAESAVVGADPESTPTGVGSGGMSAVFPRIYVFSPGGELISTKQPDILKLQSDPAAIYAKWGGDLRSEGAYRILVMADNSRLGAKASRLDAKPWESVGPVSHRLTGEVRLKLTIQHP